MVTDRDIEEAVAVLRAGGLVAFPTETVYGLGADASNPDAVRKVFDAKGRPHDHPLIVHVADAVQLANWAREIPHTVHVIARRFWPGPLTVLLPKKEIIPGIVTSGLPQVAVRVPDHSLALELLRKIDFPLAAPSANPFGYVSPTEASHVNKQLGDKVDYILDGGGVEEGKVCIYRLGGLAIEEIEKEIGKVELRINQSGDPKTPGQLKSHYAPLKPVVIGKAGDLIKKYPGKKLAVICFGNRSFSQESLKIFNLSKGGSLKEAALNLFKYLRLADESDIDLVIAEELPEEGLGRAINDRLRRAAG